MMQFPNVKTETEYVPFGGGLDLVSPALTIKPGRLIGCQNYVPDLNGGYRLYGMYERFDGRTAPSSATYQAIACTLTSTPAIGATVTIGAATGLFAGVVDGGCVLTGVSGTIPTSTSMTVSGSPVGTTAAAINLPSPTALEDAQRVGMAATVYRALIQAVPGSGPIRGVVQFEALTYAFRDNAGGTAGVMHVSSPSGWTAVDLGEEVAFTNANTSVNDNDTLTQGPVTATIRRVIVETGTLASGTNTGRLIISGRAGGNLAAGAATSTGGGALTLSGAQTANALPTGGSYYFDIYNFAGGLTTRRLYGCNGVGRAFEFDGTTFVFIRSSAATDTPRYIKAHRRYLYLAIGSSLINSSVGDPHRYVVNEGATEIAVGDTINGLASLPGEALGIMCRNSSFQLTGASASTWTLGVLRSDVGAVYGSVQTMGDTFMMDDRGITSVAASDTYGNFTSATVSVEIQPVVDTARNKVIGSYVVRRLGLYVIILNDGFSIVMGANARSLLGFTLLKLGFTPTCAFSGEDNTGQERVLVGSSDGFVYELGKGQSADGANLEAFIRVAYNSSKSPRIRKRYRKAVMQAVAQNYASLRFSGELSYGDPSIDPIRQQDIGMQGAGGFWDSSNWDEMYWDSQDVYEPEAGMAGTGTNVTLTLYKNNALDIGHVLQGAIIHFTPRRLQR
jgi:hypothetical protein